MRVATVYARPTSATATALPESQAGSFPEVIFSQPGNASVRRGESAEYDVGSATTFTEVRLTLTTAGSSTTSVEILKNGAVVATVSISASTTESATAVSLAFAAHDNLSVNCSAAGAGAVGLTAHIRDV